MGFSSWAAFTPGIKDGVMDGRHGPLRG
jgi:hypothetical protein